VFLIQNKCFPQAIIASNGKLTPNFQYIQELRLANRYVIVVPFLTHLYAFMTCAQF